MSHKATDQAPEGDVRDESYTTQQSDSIPVQSDDAELEDPIDPATADSDQQLAQDEKEALDKSNIVKERTRHAKPAQGTYQEPE